MNERPELAGLLDSHRGEKHAIILHTYPDPDAIAASYAHRVISTEYGIETTVFYTGRISHQQNLAMVRLLGMELTPYSEEVDFRQYHGVIFVDHQGTTVEEILKEIEAAGTPVLAIIDHHEVQERINAEYVDIRRVGSTATIYACYLEEGIITVDKNRRDHVTMCTALMHGILTDTSNFIQAGPDDLEAAAFFSRFRDAEVLAEIMSQNRSKSVMELIRRALENRTVAENYSVAGIGYLRAEDRDAIPQATEFLLTEENVHTAIVYGIVRDEENENLIGSMRTSKLTIDPDEFLKDVFGRNTEGRFYGGGKTTAGGFSIPIGFLVGDHGEKFKEMKWLVYDAQIKHKIFGKLDVHVEILE